ncbi:hypothetical protein OJJOAM_000954 [Cupriavidus sp. H18C1]
MPFDTPTLPKLIERTDADLAGATERVLRRSDQIVLGRVHAGAAHELHGYLAFVAKQILPDECEEDMLVRLAKFRLKVPRREAVAATGPITVVGQVGAVIDQTVVLQYADGRRYVVKAPVTLTAAQATVTVSAVEPGVAGNLPAGAALELVSPVLGIAPNATVLAPGITGGTEQESIEALRQRVIRSYRIVPDGGNADDYETWATEVAGITRAWCRRHYMGLGTVGVFVMRDDDPDPIPQPGIARCRPGPHRGRAPGHGGALCAGAQGQAAALSDPSLARHLRDTRGGGEEPARSDQARGRSRRDRAAHPSGRGN